MASQVVSAQRVESLSVPSFIRGYHAYMDMWTPVENEMLRLIPEPTNSVDRKAVAVLKEDQILGHILSPIISIFLKRDVHKAFAIVTESKINRGAGCGLEVPCIYEFYGPNPYIDKLELRESLKSSGLV